MENTYWKIEITTLDPIDKITDEYWRLNSALGFELGRKNKFDIEEKAKQVFDALPQFLKNKSSVVELTPVHEVIKFNEEEKLLLENVMKKIKYQAYWFDGDHSIGDRGQFPGGDRRRVQVDGKTVGFLKVTKEGWGQFQKKRGTPSQIWKFEPAEGNDLGSQIAKAMPYYTNYFADAKKIISTVVNDIRETTYI